MAGLLQDQDEGKTEKLAYTPDKTTADVVNDTDINGLAAAVSDVLSDQGLRRGHDRQQRQAGVVPNSQVQAAKTDDLGAQAIAKELGGLPVVADAVRAAGFGAGGARQPTTPAPVRAWTAPTRRWRRPTSRRPASPTDAAPPPSPIITAGSDDPKCVN